jgi:transketolase
LKLEQKAKWVRKEIFKFKTKTGIGHLASCLSCVDLVVSLFYDNNTLFNHEDDILLFSKAHGSPSVYPVLADFGYFDNIELEKYCTADGILKLHSDHTIPGCHFVGGSLGNGLGYAAGLAYKSDKKVYVMLGDAELYEGTIWESLIFIAHHNLNNMHLIVDRNKMGILGKTEETLRLEPLRDKFEAFGFETDIADGHNFTQLQNSFCKLSDRPRLTIANTVKGKGVSYMEDKWQYHTIIPKDEISIGIGIKELS